MAKGSQWWRWVVVVVVCVGCARGGGEQQLAASRGEVRAAVVRTAVVREVGEEVVPAHSHNDYYRERPLMEALEAGCVSVEVDVFERGGVLLVGHDEHELREDRTMEGMYLKPLWAMVERDGAILPGGKALILLVDFKTPAGRTYPALVRELEKYRGMLHRVEGGKRVAGAVRVVVTGNRPMEEIAGEAGSGMSSGVGDRLADLDGRPGELAGTSAEVVAMQSANWRSYFGVGGFVALTAEQKAKLGELVAEGKSRGRLVRFWAMPDNEAGWRLAVESGIDLVNTDKPGEFAEFYRRWQRERADLEKRDAAEKKSPGR